MILGPVGKELSANLRVELSTLNRIDSELVRVYSAASLECSDEEFARLNTAYGRLAIALQEFSFAFPGIKKDAEHN